MLIQTSLVVIMCLNNVVVLGVLVSSVFDKLRAFGKANFSWRPHFRETNDANMSTYLSVWDLSQAFHWEDDSTCWL